MLAAAVGRSLTTVVELLVDVDDVVALVVVVESVELVVDGVVCCVDRRKLFWGVVAWLGFGLRVLAAVDGAVVTLVVEVGRGLRVLGAVESVVVTLVPRVERVVVVVEVGRGLRVLGAVDGVVVRLVARVERVVVVVEVGRVSKAVVDATVAIVVRLVADEVDEALVEDSDGLKDDDLSVVVVV